MRKQTEHEITTKKAWHGRTDQARENGMGTK